MIFNEGVMGDGKDSDGTSGGGESEAAILRLFRRRLIKEE